MLGGIFPESEVAVFGGDLAEAEAFSRLPFDHLVFTGSSEVGRHVMRAAAEHLVPLTLELGGKSPALVAPGADLADAAKRIAHGRTLSGGQVCVAPDYALVQRDHVEPFAEAVCAAFGRMYCSLQGSADYTALATDRRAQRIREMIVDAEAKGARVVAAGADGPGRRIALRVVTRVREDMTVMQQEIFGPILPVVPYDTLDDAIAYITARRGRWRCMPSAGRCRTRGSHAPHACRRHGDQRLRLAGVQPRPAVRRIGNSGMGSYHGEEGFRAMSHAKPVYVRHRFFPIGCSTHPMECGAAAGDEVLSRIPARAAGRTQLGKKGESATTAGPLG